MELAVFLYFTLLSLVLPLHTMALTTNRLLSSDQSALLAFKDGVTSDPTGALLSWNETTHVCEWEGVSCTRSRPRRVSSLEIHSRGLTGSISPSLTNLTSLVKLTLTDNSFHGEIPLDLGRLYQLQWLSFGINSLSGEIPDSLSNCSALQLLFLYTNNLSGPIPSGLGNLPDLHKLHLDQNSLTGPIPASLGNASLILSLSLCYNFLDGSIPEALGRLAKMEFLQLSVNWLTGEIPPSLFNYSALYHLGAALNLLNGSLPPDIGTTLPALENLVLATNHFQGRIPASLVNASRLSYVDLLENSFTGPVPSHLGRLQNLSKLNLGHNRLEPGWGFLTSLTNCSKLRSLMLNHMGSRGATLPDSVGNLSTQLQKIALDFNGFVGRFPRGIGNLVNLHTLFMGGNQFTDVISEGFGKLRKLQLLSMYSSGLTGGIPSSLGNLTNLLYLVMPYNRLNGPIPSSLGNLQLLTQLDLSSNRLNGNIPKELFSIASLSYELNLSRNSLVGSLPVEVGALKNLNMLDISRNKLSGVIPDHLESCESLEILYMSENLFSGSIPSPLSNIKALRELNLSHNELSGVIPESLQKLGGLSALDLSFNQLQGEVPTKGVFANATAVLLVGNDRLCGKDVAKFGLPKCEITGTRESRSWGLKKAILITIPLLCFILLVSRFIVFYRRLYLRKQKLGSSASVDDDKFRRISYNELAKATDGFSLSNLVGRGSYGSVYRGTLDPNAMVAVAVKVFDLELPGATKSFTAECEVLRSIRHCNLIKVFTSCSSVDSRGDNFKALVFEFMPNRSLDEWLHPVDGGRGVMSLVQRLNIAVGVADALQYLHHDCQPPVVHCDLKPCNVLLDEDYNARVGDFGLSKVLSLSPADNNSSVSTGIKGSIGYFPPEYGAGGRVSTSGDVYSYGILLLEMFTGKRPTDAMFKDDLQLQEFVKIAIPNRIMEIADPLLMLQENNKTERIQDCLVSMLQVGLLCCNPSPKDRRDMRFAASEVHSIRDAY